MDFDAILTDAFIGLIGLVISSLGIYVTYLINKNIKNKELKEIISSFNEVVKNAVLEVYQTYVEELKCNNMFDAKAQKKALSKALDIIKTNMTEDMKKWLESNHTNIEAYLKSLVEAQIGLLKNKSIKEG